MKLRLTLLLVFSIASMQVHAQGCSDAGFCTAGSLKQASITDTSASRHKLTLSVANGLGDDGVFVSTPAIQYDWKAGKNIALQCKINGNYASGRLASIAGPGDILIDIVADVSHKSKLKVALVGGLKIPLNSSNLNSKGVALPMQYQSSLGTYDAILGATFNLNNWWLSVGGQQPLSGTNGNNYSSIMAGMVTTNVYPESNKLRRSGDVLLKVGYAVALSSRWRISPGILAIYHVSEDKFYNNATGKEEKLIGSDGLTVNATVNTTYTFSKWSVGLIAGSPLVVRDIRPDGLTRSIVFMPEISFNL